MKGRPARIAITTPGQWYYVDDVERLVRPSQLYKHTSQVAPILC